MKTLWIIFGLLLCLYSCSSPESKSKLDLKTIEPELRSMESNHRTAVDNKNVEGILQFYATDLITISQGEPILYGRDWIEDTMNELYKTYDFQEDFKFIDLRIVGEKVAASFTFKQQMLPLLGGDTVVQTGKGMCILKQSEAGNWQFEWNCYSYDNPPEAK
jgi:ketosteroid isomerase-like protein